MAGNGDVTPSSRELLFIQLTSMLQFAAMQNMGKLVNPVTNEVERDLEQAKVSIDTLEMLKEKTKGNLTSMEEDFLNKILFEVHMNYVDEKKGEGTGPAEAEASESGEEEQPEGAEKKKKKKPRTKPKQSD